jgi:hypothetical protein
MFLEKQIDCTSKQNYGHINQQLTKNVSRTQRFNIANTTAPSLHSTLKNLHLPPISHPVSRWPYWQKVSHLEAANDSAPPTPDLPLNKSPSQFPPPGLKTYLVYFFSTAQPPLVGQDRLIIKPLLSHSDTRHSVGLLWTSDHPDAETSTWQHTILTWDTHPWNRRDSNSQSQQMRGRRTTPLTARSQGSAA